MDRKLRMGMVGGGAGAFIGGVHRMAANLDGKVELVAGAFSSKPERSRETGRELYLDSNRVYGNYREMAEAEAKLPLDKRIDFVSVVTPNSSHFDISRTFFEAGFNVVCDKPMTSDLEQAIALRKIARETGKVFALTHNYTGYPMVKEAREMVRNGELGKVLKIVVEYSQGWLISALEKEDQKQASWRTDPKQAGISCCIADIGSHAENLARYITGLRVEKLCADFASYVPGRQLEDDGSILIRYHGGARGVLCASQVLAGEENNLNIRVYGDNASIEWYQEHPNELVVKYPDQARRTFRRGNSYVSDVAGANTRLPFGHPEGFIEAFANVYLAAAKAIEAEVSGEPVSGDIDFPDVDDGVEGMNFIHTAVRSARSDEKWTVLQPV